MNCKQARSLFSARIDGELTSLEDRGLQHHLDGCAKGCAERWASFETTVRLVHGLPGLEPDPSFVGQVLDRVRGYEAGHLRPRVVSRPSFGARLRSLVADRIFAFPLPARFAAVGAFGIAAGFLLASGLDWKPFTASAPVPGLSARVEASAAPATGRDTNSAAQTPRPFADLADELNSTRSARTQDDSMAQDSRRLNLPDGASPLRIVKGDERPPQIVF